MAGIPLSSHWRPCFSILPPSRFLHFSLNRSKSGHADRANQLNTACALAEKIVPGNNLFAATQAILAAFSGQITSLEGQSTPDTAQPRQFRLPRQLQPL